MIYVYRSKISESAKLLTDGLEGDRLKIFNGQTFQRREGGTIIRPRRHDVIVCWGEELPAIVGPRILNGAQILNKMDAALKLKAEGVETVEVAAVRPVVNQAADLFEPGVAESVNRTQAQALGERIRQYLATPVPVIETWLPRTFNHIGGHDLLNAPVRPDYFSKKENIIEEFRIHIFNGKSIRAGVKKHRDGAVAHNWIRSYDGGWNICYNDFHSKKSMRALAVKAVTALGLQFGAVDIGKRADGSLIVLEVNRAPGLEGGTVTSYTNAIQQWVEAE